MLLFRHDGHTLADISLIFIRLIITPLLRLFSPYAMRRYYADTFDIIIDAFLSLLLLLLC